MRRKHSLLNRVFLLSVGSIVFFIALWSGYFYLRLLPLGVDAFDMFYREILPGLVLQGLVFAILFRLIYSRILGRRFRMLLGHVNQFLDGESADSSMNLLEGADEISEVGRQVELMFRFLRNTGSLLHEKVIYVKNGVLQLQNSSARVEQACGQVLKSCEENRRQLAEAVRILETIKDKLSAHYEGLDLEKQIELIESVEEVCRKVNGSKSVFEETVQTLAPVQEVQLKKHTYRLTQTVANLENIAEQFGSTLATQRVPPELKTGQLIY